ncbi:3063_t:CDS:1, partial [Dentiscutata heterogama]
STSEQLTDEQELTSEFEFNEDELSDDGYESDNDESRVELAN